MGAKRGVRYAARYMPPVAYAAYNFMKRKGTAGKVGYRVPAFSITDQKKKRRSTGGVTSQYDRKVIYSFKKMPRYKRKQWKRFVNKVNAVQDKNLVSHTCLRNGELVLTHPDGGDKSKQFFGAMHLYGWAGAPSDIEVGNGDIADLVNRDDNTNLTSQKFRFTSAVFDCTMQNTGDTTLEVDLYHIIHTKQSNFSRYNDQQAMAEAGTGVPTPTGAFTSAGISLSDRGATPFDFPLLSKAGNKIIKKTKYILSPNQVATFQYRDASNRYCSTAYTIAGYIWKGKTQTFLVICKPVAGSYGGTSKLNIGCTRNYGYKWLDSGNEVTDFKPIGG